MIPITIPSLLSLEGMTSFIYLLMAAVNSAAVIPSRLVPLAAIALGGVAGAAAAFAGHSDVGNAVLLGIVAGGLSSGIEETRKGVAHLTSRKPAGSADPEV